MAENHPPANRHGVRSGKKKGRRKSRPPRSSAGSNTVGKTPTPPPAVDATLVVAIAVEDAVEDATQAPVSLAAVLAPADPAATATNDMPLPGASTSERPAIWQKPLPHHRQAYAAIDLGTNNCRLLIARPSGEHFVVIDAFSRVVRLGEGLAQTGYLSQEAMDRALAALHVCADKLRKRNVHLARSVATEACRRATNGAAFIDRVYEETGIRLNIITAQEEARLAVLGCHILLEQDRKSVV